MAALVAIVAVLVLCPLRATAQETLYKFDFGGGIGMSGYAGEASKTVFNHPGFAGELGFRYLPTSRWAVRCSFSVLTISGNTADMDNVLPGGANYEFKSTVYDLAAHAEFNFFSYGIGETYKKMRRWTPYLTLGIGATLANCSGRSAFAPNIPMGVGVKFKMRERWNLVAEFTMTKVFNDKIDGPDLTDLSTIKSSFIKNNDWYSRLTIGVTYEFGKRCETCHYVD